MKDIFVLGVPTLAAEELSKFFFTTKLLLTMKYTNLTGKRSKLKIM